jgi:hypothetical protein
MRDEETSVLGKRRADRKVTRRCYPLSERSPRSEGSARGSTCFIKPASPEGSAALFKTYVPLQYVRSRRTFPASRRTCVLREAPEVKLLSESWLLSESARGEASRRKRRTPFLREEAEGRPSFGRKPKDVLFSKQVRFLRLPSASWILSESARGEA